MLSADTLNIPIILPVLMTKGPRWNTHGIIGTLGPFPIESTLTVNLDQAQRSAQSLDCGGLPLPPIMQRLPN